MSSATTCPRCRRFARYAGLRCYDYRDGWMCVHCETPADRVVTAGLSTVA